MSRLVETERPVLVSAELNEATLRAAFPFLPPPAGTPEAAKWTSLGLTPPVKETS